MKIRELMEQDVQYCTLDCNLHRAASLMWDCDCGCLPVVDSEQKCIGVITDRDICMSAFTQGRKLQDISVVEAYSADPIYCSENASLEDAEVKMRQFQVRRLPIVDDQGRLKGIISLNNMVLNYPKYVTSKQVAKVLAGICQPNAVESETRIV